MRNLFTNLASTVDAGTARSGMASRMHRMQIVNGSAWVTIEGELRDYWLSAGDTLDIHPGRLVVVEAERNDVALKVIPAAQGSFNTLGSLIERTWKLLQLRIRQPITSCASTGNAIGQQVCGAKRPA